MKKKKKFKKVIPLSSVQQQTLQQAAFLQQQGQLGRAQEMLEGLLAENSKSPDINLHLGSLMSQQGRLQEAEPLLLKAVDYSQSDVRCPLALGDLYLKTQALDKAIAAFESAVKLDANAFDAWFYLGTANLSARRFTQAKKALTRAVELNPSSGYAYNNLGDVYLGLCDIHAAGEAYERAYAVAPEFLTMVSNKLACLNYRNDVSREAIYKSHCEAAKAFPQSNWQPATRPAGTEKIRVGYLSGDFRIHSVAYFLLPLISHHDRSRFEIVCFYSGQGSDVMTERFKAAADHWYAVSGLQDEALLSLMRKQDLDILVDLAGHTGNNRLPVFSQRAARVQINWLGYPHSTGLPSMDYRIVDDITDPAPQADGLNTEQLLRLPHGFLCYGGDADLPLQTEPPCLQSGDVTFGSFNNLAKVTDEVLATWAEILAAVPGSRLVIKAKQSGEKEIIRRYQQVFESAGVDPGRLEMMPFAASAEDHLALYSKVDIALDTFPYNGTTTTCEALWMGVPTVTFAGDRHAARVGASVMMHAGLPEFIAADVPGYKALAIAWAERHQELKTLRATMRANIQQSDLCNAIQFAQEIEQAFATAIAGVNSAE